MIGGTIVCMGDSLTHGARDPYSLHYPALLGRKLSKKHGQAWIGLEYGVNGETSGDLVRRAWSHLKANPEASEVCIWIGSNDAKQNVLTPEDVYRENLEELIRMCRFRGKPVFLGLIPHQSGFGAPDYMDNALVDKYNEILLDLVWRQEDANKNRMVWYVDLHPLPTELKCDGIHLKHEGNHWVADRFLEVIEMKRSGKPVAGSRRLSAFEGAPFRD